ncbi:hypothetical protein D5F01_LYC13226 [Larimichthys crocea]|uniref:Uncharacterized protein n=1 Tax=Larimichthys crocea TaxID=215358 RepID=A0A6G0IDB4_LARCR|nr:hypothetical protein D5F01_LYC13226 [Larimichthys crocea]
MLDKTEPAHCTVCCCTLANKILMGYLKASLAVADLAVGIFVVPLSVYAEVYLMVTDSAPEWTSYNSHSEIALEYNSCSRMCNYALGNIGEFPSPAWNILLLFPAFDFTLLGGTMVINIISLSSIRQHSKRRKHLAETESTVTKPTFSDIKAAKQ